MLHMIWMVNGKRMMSQSRVFEWHHRFKSSCKLIEHNSDSKQHVNSQNKDSVKQVQELAVFQLEEHCAPLSTTIGATITTEALICP